MVKDYSSRLWTLIIATGTKHKIVHKNENQVYNFSVYCNLMPAGKQVYTRWTNY